MRVVSNLTDLSDDVFELEEEVAQAVQACNQRGYHNFLYQDYNLEGFQEWIDEALENINLRYQDLGLQYSPEQGVQNAGYGNIRRPPSGHVRFPIFRGVTCEDCGTTMEHQGIGGGQYTYAIEGAEEEMAQLTHLYQDQTVLYPQANYPQFYDEDGNWNRMQNGVYYPRYNTYRNLNQNDRLISLMNVGESILCDNCNTYYYPQLDDPNSQASQWLQNRWGRGMCLSPHTHEEHEAHVCSPHTEEECEHCGGVIKWGGKTTLTEQQARASHGEGICVSTIIECDNCGRDYVILRQGMRYGQATTVSVDGVPRPVMVYGPHYNSYLSNELHNYGYAAQHISEIDWDQQQGRAIVKGYDSMANYRKVHDERDAGEDKDPLPSLCSDGVAQVMSVAALKRVIQSLGKRGRWKGWNKIQLVKGIGAKWDENLKKATRKRGPSKPKQLDKANVLEYINSLKTSDPDLYDEMMEEMFGAEYMTNPIIEVEGYWPKRVESFQDTVIFYVGRMADVRYEHSGVSRKELGSDERIISIIDPEGIKVSDVEKVLGREWDGRYFLFEEGKTFIGGERKYSAEDYDTVNCHKCKKVGYSDEMGRDKIGYLCTRCSRPDIDWAEMDVKYGVPWNRRNIPPIKQKKTQPQKRDDLPLGLVVSMGGLLILSAILGGQRNGN